MKKKMESRIDTNKNGFNAKDANGEKDAKTNFEFLIHESEPFVGHDCEIDEIDLSVA